MEKKTENSYNKTIMLSKLKYFIRSYTPRSLLSFYHLLLAQLGAFLFGFPSRQLIVIGVTGTTGKSTTVFILHQLLAAMGKKVGSLSTIAFIVDDQFELNNRKMTMLGRFEIQRFLRKMVNRGCQYAIIETTSEGIEQHRHRGIHYDEVLFTNLYPEHIEAHGSFENYKKAKLKLFAYLASRSQKNFKGKVVPRTIIANADDEHVSDFLNFPVDKKMAVTTENRMISGVEPVSISQISLSREGAIFAIDEHLFKSPLRGRHNVLNTILALAALRALGFSWDELQGAVQKLPFIPGRFEYINEGQKGDIIVDYAFEPKAMENLYEALRSFGYTNIIQVLGGTGGGRDRARRPILGAMAAQFADVVIITNEDPYDESPRAIMEDVKQGALCEGKKEGLDLFVIEDRAEAISHALSLLGPGGLVLITGKGSEQAIAGPRGVLFPWDDREAVRRALRDHS